jgi:hypothetical protein
MQAVRAILRDSGRARARRTLRRDAFHTHRQRNQNAEKQDRANKKRFFHTCSFVEAWFHTQ